jgi:DNA-binding NarL/FixJ family response regulator
MTGIYRYNDHEIDQVETGGKHLAWEDLLAGEQPAQRQIRVLLADDHPHVRAGIRMLLSQAPDIDVVGEAANGLQAISLVEELKPDVLLLDMEMPLMNGTQVAASLRKACSPVRILVLSAYNDQQYIMDLLENGASGYLIKEEVPEILVTAVRSVANGADGWVSRSVAERIAGWRKAKSGEQPTLTFRELDILRLMAANHNDEEIAVQIGITVPRVERHIDILLMKLHARSREDLVLHARHMGVA